MLYHLLTYQYAEKNKKTKTKTKDEKVYAQVYDFAPGIKTKFKEFSG